MTHRSPPRLQLLYFAGCPHHEPLQRRLPELLAQAGIDARPELIEVRNDADAHARHFLGSPTLRVDGRDVDPGAESRSDYGLKCRVYPTAHGLQGRIPDAMIRAALSRGDRAP